MLPISIAGSIRTSWPSTVSPASTLRTSTWANSKSRPGLDAAQVRVGLVGAGDVGIAVQRGVHQDRDSGPDRADVARRADLLRELDLLRGPEGDAERVAELDVVDAVVAADQHEPQLVLADDDRIGLDQRARGHAERLGDLRRPSSGPAWTPLAEHPAQAAARPASASPSRPRRWRRSPRPAPRRSRPPDRAPCTRARRCRPSSRRRNRPGTTPARSGRRSCRRPRGASRSRRPGPRRRGRTCRSPS